MKVATWNVNSVRSRCERLVRWLKTHSPDVVCLQETKVVNRSFPDRELEQIGYHSAVHGQRTYNGVAVLSRRPIEDVTTGLQDGLDDSQARLIAVRTGGVRVLSVYVPNGGRAMSEQYEYKLEWLRRFRMALERRYRPDEPLIIGGDFNVIPQPRDATRWSQWRGTVLGSTQVRRLFEEIVRWGVADTFRLHTDVTGHYSWWDYRHRSYDRDDGVRIDFVLASHPLAERCTTSWIDRDERDPKAHKTKPSDHAPVVSEFDVSELPGVCDEASEDEPSEVKAGS